MTDLTPNLALPEIIAAQAQKHVTHNEALRALDALVQLAVLDRDLTAPPETPGEGGRWLVAADATGDWSGHDDDIAARQDGGWSFYTPKVGWLAYAIDESLLLAWDGAAWQPALDLLGNVAQNMTLLGIGTTADAANPFSAKLNNALWAARTVAEGGDGTLRYKMSKAGAGDTLSLLMQDNFSGRAELGLTGDDDFHLKVSADGTAWREAMVVDHASGAVSFPNSAGLADLDLTLAQLALGVADALNSAQYLGNAGNRFADSFDALTYVDVAAATNLDAATAGVLKPARLAGTTGTFAQASDVARSVSAVFGHAGLSFTAPLSGWLTTTRWSISGVDSAGNVEARLYADSAGSPGALIGSSAQVTVTAAGPVTLTFGAGAAALSADTGYWIVLAAIGGTGVAVDSCVSQAGYGSGRNTTIAAITDTGIGFSEEWRVEINYEYGAANLTVASTALTTAATASGARLVARVKEIDTVALNTDLVASVSRDDGATWTAFVLTRRFSAGGIAVYESAVLDLSGTPAGSTMRWKLATANNKAVEIHDVCLYWA